MRSLTVKLTLAFMLVGILGAVLVAVLVGQRTRSEFDRFLSERDRATLTDNLSTYYVTHGSWNGVASMLNSIEPQNDFIRSMALADAAGRVVLGNQRFALDSVVDVRSEPSSSPITANNQIVGYALVPSSQPPPYPNGGNPSALNNSFLNRLTIATAISVAVAGMIALLLGAFLARTLTRPVRELTAATEAMARGELNQRVAVHSRDEIGDLATSFNQMSADLARSSQLRKQMTADLAHDLRTPLSILRGYTEGLQDERLRGTPTVYRVMHGEVQHLQRLVEDLRVLSLADAGELSLNQRTIDPSALLERTGLAYFDQAEQQGIVLRVEADQALPSIMVDTDRMTQVLNNLVSNALRYTEHGEVVLAAHAADQQVRLEVRDTGSGIAAADLPFIFDRFYRADKARQRSGDIATSGLGLAITKAIVEAHGGGITAASTPGEGTTFSITLPVQPQQSSGGDPKAMPGERAVTRGAEQLSRRA